MLTISFSAIAHLQKAPSPPVQKMCPILDASLMGENNIIFVK